MPLKELAVVEHPWTGHPVSDAVVESVVRELNELHRTATLDFALKVGHIITQRFYNGDLTVWRSHTVKEASFRKLAGRADSELHLSATTLYRAVALYELCERVDVSFRKHLGVAHLRAVLGLSADQQHLLLRAARDSDWTAQQVQAAAAKLRNKVNGRGRPRLLPFVRTVRRLSRLLDDPDAGLAGLEHADQLARTEVMMIRRQLTAIRRQMDVIETKLKSGSSCDGPAVAPALQVRRPQGTPPRP
jgi:hypothetical protein